MRSHRRRSAPFEALEARQMYAATQVAVPVGSARLTGTVVGTAGSWQNKGNTAAKVFDANAGTYFDAPAGADSPWAGLDLGTAARVMQVRFVPRNGFAGRMTGGQFQGANAADFSDAVTLAAVTAAPAGGRYTAAAVADGGTYRYVRYVAPASAAGNVAEVEFDGVPVATVAPLAPADPVAVVTDAAVRLTWAAVGAADTYAVQRQGPGDVDFVPVATTIGPAYADAAVVVGGTYAYRVVAANAVGTSEPSAAVTVTVPVVPPPVLPPPVVAPPVVAPPVVGVWADADIGGPGRVGSSMGNADGTLTVVGGGADIWNQTDQFHFTSQPLVGNGSVVARVVAQQNTNSWAKAGVMVRESGRADSRFVLLALTPGNGVTWQVRSATHTTPAVSRVVAGQAGVMLRIVRDGDTFTGSLSTDGGATWTVVGTATVPMVGNVLAGAAVTSHDNGKVSAATFAGLAVTATGTPASAWTAAAAAPLNRWESETFTAGGKLYVFGGFVDRDLNATARCDVYDPAADSWTRLADVPTGPLTHAAVTVVGGVAYLAGGDVGAFNGHRPGTAVATVLTYDIATDTWGTMTALPAAQTCGGLVAIDNHLIYYGGLNAALTADLTTTWSLDLADPGSGWQARAAMPNGRNHLGAVAIDGVAYAIGGWHRYDVVHGCEAEVDAYDPRTDTWRRVASLPVPLGSIETSTFAANGHAVVVGGNTNGGYDGIYQAAVLSYDPGADRWTTAAVLPEANEGMSTAYVDGRLIAVGGTVDNRGGWSQDQTWVTAVVL